MKTLLPFLLVVFAATTVSAQLSRGTVLIGGTAGINNVSIDGEGSTIVTVAPQLGYFFTDRFALGTSLGIGLEFSDGETSSSFGLNPFARYYFNGAGSTRLFGQVNAGFQTFKFAGLDATTALTYGLGLGVDFFLNDRVAIEGLLGYQRLQGTDDGDDGINTIGVTFGVAAFIGGGGE